MRFFAYIIMYRKLFGFMKRTTTPFLALVLGGLLLMGVWSQQLYAQCASCMCASPTNPTNGCCFSSGTINNMNLNAGVNITICGTVSLTNLNVNGGSITLASTGHFRGRHHEPEQWFSVN